MPRRYTVTWLARNLNTDRTNVYNIFNRKSVDTDLLMRIGNILQHDFFADISARLHQ